MAVMLKTSHVRFRIACRSSNGKRSISKWISRLSDDLAANCQVADGSDDYDDFHLVIGEAVSNAFGHCDYPGAIVIERLAESTWHLRISNPAFGCPKCEALLREEFETIAEDHRGILIIDESVKALRGRGWLIEWDYSFVPVRQRTVFCLDVVKTRRPCGEKYGRHDLGRRHRLVVTQLSRGKIP